MFMTEPSTRDDFASFPAPAEGILVTMFITVRKVARSRDFYSRVLGGTVILEENPCTVRLSNSWIIMNPGGPPTPDKPGISVVDYQPGDTTSIFLNLRVADIQACYEEWKAKGAEFVTPPIDRGAEIRCYVRDPAGTSSRSASPPACCTASSPLSALRTSLAELSAPAQGPLPRQLLRCVTSSRPANRHGKIS
jgi:predicted enzyme related to lactoylglutathione lyase